MIIQLHKNIDRAKVDSIIENLNQNTIKSNFVKTQFNDYLVCFSKVKFDIRKFGHLDGVQDVHSVTDDYKLVSKKWKLNSTTIDLGEGLIYEKGNPIVIAGPCSVETEKQMELLVEHLVKNNIKIIRGGVFKPRSSPYAFRGLGIEGLKMMHELCNPHHIKIVTEVMQVSQI